MTNTKSTQTDRDKNASKGFASMPHDKVSDIARKGGHASAAKAGHEGMSERGHKGGEARASQLGHEGYVELGHKGGAAPHESRGRARGEEEGNDTSGSSGKRGFASMPKEKVREAGRKGGEHSHRGSASSEEE